MPNILFTRSPFSGWIYWMIRQGLEWAWGFEMSELPHPRGNKAGGALCIMHQKGSAYAKSFHISILQHVHRTSSSHTNHILS
jgi:hypothetical protein